MADDMEARIEKAKAEVSFIPIEREEINRVRIVDFRLERF